MTSKTKTIKRAFIYTCTVGISIVILFFFILGTWIGYDAKTICQNAKRTYDGDCIEALITLLQDEKQGYRERNNAIWALGQFGDARALPALKNLYTGNIPEREPLHKTISQYELKKATNLTSGGTNISAFIWRSFFN